MVISILTVNKIEPGIFSTDYKLGNSPLRILEMQRFSILGEKKITFRH